MPDSLGVPEIMHSPLTTWIFNPSGNLSHSAFVKAEPVKLSFALYSLSTAAEGRLFAVIFGNS